METSEKQIQANRENGRLGGVKTPEGKEISRMNAQKHGLTSDLLIDYDEDDEFQAFENELKKELNPTTKVQEILFERILTNYIRLLRAMKLERVCIHSLLNPPKVEKVYNNEDEGRIYKERLAKYQEAKNKGEVDMHDSFSVFPIQEEKPKEPEYKMIIHEGNRLDFSLEDLKLMVDTTSRYYTSSENRLYKALKEFRQY
jgi:hypothetical protein